MVFNFVLIGVFILMGLSVLLNAFGIYCLRKQSGGNTNQRLLLQNLSIIEITKILYDFISLGLFHTCKSCYKKYSVFLDIVEINFMTVLFVSVLLITIDRLCCVVLSTRYKRSVTEKLVKEILISTWLISFTSGLFMWAIVTSTEYVKIYYYMSFDIIIIVMTGIVYLTMIVLIQKRRNKFTRASEKRNMKMFLVPTLIVTSFILCNAIPDLILIRHYNNVTYGVISYLWALGFVTDPLIYIFVGKRSRKVAKAFFVCFQRCCGIQKKCVSKNNSCKRGLVVKYAKPHQIQDDLTREISVEVR